MAKFSAKAYAQKIQKKAEAALPKALENTIAPHVKRAMYLMIKENVYDSYSPRVYERRGSNDGLLDENNIISQVDGNRLRVKNIAQPNDSLFGTPLYSEPSGLLYKWIDEGLVPPVDAYPWQKKRMNLTAKMNKYLFESDGFKIKLNEAVRKEMNKK